MNTVMSTSVALVDPSRKAPDIGATLTNWPNGLPILPDSTPSTALAAALILADIGGVFAVDLYARDGKMPCMRAYQDTVEYPKRDRDGIWHNSTRNAYAIREFFGPRGRYASRRYGVGLALRDAELLALDIDDARGADQLAALVAAGGGWAWPTFAVLSRKGPKLIYRRPARLAGLNKCVQKSRDKAGANIGEGLAACDVCLHYILAWAPDRRWLGTPADIADLPGGAL